jgi:hypothetical protein
LFRGRGSEREDHAGGDALAEEVVVVVGDGDFPGDAQAEVLDGAGFEARDERDGGVVLAFAEVADVEAVDGERRSETRFSWPIPFRGGGGAGVEKNLQKWPQTGRPARRLGVRFLYGVGDCDRPVVPCVRRSRCRV